MKTHDMKPAAEAAVQVTRAAALFDRLADDLVEQLRARLERCELDADARKEQLRLLRERLDAFFPEFRQLYGGLLVKHLGSDGASVIAALQDETAQRYFRAVQAMQGELQGGLARLSDRMVLAAQLATPSLPQRAPAFGSSALPRSSSAR